jgi:hypothetical protein
MKRTIVVEKMVAPFFSTRADRLFDSCVAIVAEKWSHHFSRRAPTACSTLHSNRRRENGRTIFLDARRLPVRLCIAIVAEKMVAPFSRRAPTACSTPA